MTKAKRGFTLIELMVAITVLMVLSIIAVPMFTEVRQRASVRGAAEQALGVWQQARLEAAKRNTWVKVGLIQSGSGTTYCIGAATATSATDTTPCNCAASACDIASFGAVQQDWKGATLTGSTTGAAVWPSATPLAAVIEPKQGALAVAGQKGYFEFKAPPGRRNYRLRLSIDQFGRAVLCQPMSDTDKLSDFGGRKC